MVTGPAIGGFLYGVKSIVLLVTFGLHAYAKYCDFYGCENLLFVWMKNHYVFLICAENVCLLYT